MADDPKTPDPKIPPQVNAIAIVRMRDSEPFFPLFKAYEFDAAYDLTVVRHQQIRQNNRVQVAHNMAVVIPRGYYGMIVPRSSAMHHKGLLVQTGVIDETYRGELMTVVMNPNLYPVTLNAEERVSQLLIVKKTEFQIAAFEGAAGQNAEARMETFMAKFKTDRGDRGFGSSGGYRKPAGTI